MSRVLFVTSNGTGLGHLTRGMAIARRFDPGLEPVFLTLSAAAPVVEQAGFPVEYFPSHSAAAAEAPRRWDRRLRGRLDLLFDELAPDVLVFDGAHPYDALIAVLRARRGGPMRSVWCRRPMWRPGFGSEAIYWAGEFDQVLEPGELAASADCGLTVDRRDEAVQVGPIVYLDESELLSREAASRELGLDPDRPHALVALGQGAELNAAVERSLARLDAEADLQVAALESSLSPHIEVADDVAHLRGTYPMSRFYRAFDLAISAAGYNAFHELLAHGVPSLFVPMPRQIDDQPARALWAQDSGLGRGVSGPSDPTLERRLDELLDPNIRLSIRNALEALPSADGAQQAADWLTALMGEGIREGPEGAESGIAAPRFAAARSADERGSNAGIGSAEHAQRSRDESGRHAGGRPAATRDQKHRSSIAARLSVSLALLRRVGLRLPLIVARRAKERITDPPPPAAKLAAIALGIPPGELVPRLNELAHEQGVPPHRLLAITDSLQFAELRRAGFAFEYVPSAERAARISDEPYERFAERRIEAALRGRRRARRTTL